MSDSSPRSARPSAAPADTEDVTADLVRLMSRDLVFMMRFLGESQYRMQSHFQTFIADRLAREGVTQDSHPMIHTFIETHAILLRDFVFSGVSLSRHFRIDEIERLMGDTTSVMRVDIWDQLRSHIEAAERQFTSQLGSLDAILATLPAPPQSPSAGAAP